MKFHEKLQTLRKEKGLSQEKLGNEIGVSRQAITKWENGTSLPEVEKIVILSEYFNVTTDYLLKDAIEMPQTTAAAADTLKENKRKVSLRLKVGGLLLTVAALIWFALWVLSLCFPVYSLTGSRTSLLEFLEYHQILHVSCVIAGAGFVGLLLICTELLIQKKNGRKSN